MYRRRPAVANDGDMGIDAGIRNANENVREEERRDGELRLAGLLAGLVN
jgi:hypothetical protein